MPNVKGGRRYQINNWSEYNKALVKRGSLTVWVEEGVTDEWFASNQEDKKGRPKIYSDGAILMMLVLREVFHLPLRALQGFVISIFTLMSLTLPVPCYSQVSRRAGSLKMDLKRLIKRGVKELVFDASGLKVYGEGEWKVRTHGKGKRRTWRKLHIGIDPNSHEIVVQELTENSAGDAHVAEKLLESFEKLERVYGDGAYDGRAFRQAAYERGAECIVPPPSNATYKGASEGWTRARDVTLAEMKGLGDEGRSLWKKIKRYHRRSLGETAFFRIKTLFGDRLKAHSWEGQRVEAYVKCLAVNVMTSLGMPRGEWVEIAS